MSTVIIPTIAKKKLRYYDYVRNGKLVDAHFASQLAEAANMCVYTRGKELFRWNGGLIAAGGNGNTVLVPGSNGTRVRWRFAAHTSPKVNNVVAELLMAPATGTAYQSGTHIELTDVTGTITYGSADCIYGSSISGGTDSLTNWGVCQVKFAVPGDTDVYGFVRDFNGGRVVACTIYEEMLPGDTANGYVAGNYAANGSISADDRSAIATLARDHWKRGAAQSWNWCVNLDASLQVNGTTTDKNLIDATSTTVTTSTPGVTLDMRNKARFATSSTVAMKMCVYGKDTSIPSGIVKLKDSGGATVASVSNFAGTPGWLTTTFTLPTTKAKYDLTFAATVGASAISVGAVSIFEIE